MIDTFSITYSDTLPPPPPMSLSSIAKRNIAFLAMNNFLDDSGKVAELATFIATTIIEQEIGFASENIHPGLFTELTAQLHDAISDKLTELNVK